MSKRLDTSRHRPVPAWAEQLAGKWERKADALTDDDFDMLELCKHCMRACANELREASQREGS